MKMLHCFFLGLFLSEYVAAHPTSGNFPELSTWNSPEFSSPEFSSPEFSDPEAYFASPEFSDPEAYFGSPEFSDPEAYFASPEFSDPEAYFASPEFSDPEAYFASPEFSDPEAYFGNTDKDLASNVQLKYFNRLNKHLGSSWVEGGQKISFTGSELSIEDVTTFLPDIKTVFITHGYRGSSSYPESCETWVQKYLALEEDVQIICIDWRSLAAADWGGLYWGYYDLQARNSVAVGSWLGRLLVSLVRKTNLNVDKVHLIGFSLGAHVVGKMGYVFKARSNQQVARVTGLDPAGPLFVQNKYGLKKHMIGRDSGAFVDIIHTNGHFNPKKWTWYDPTDYYGALDALGHADFYPNGGMTQLASGCQETSYIKFNSCSHSRALEYYLKSILVGPDALPYPAYPCDSAKTCSEGIKSGTTVENYMGEYAKKPKGDHNKLYYLDITDDMGITNKFE